MSIYKDRKGRWTEDPFRDFIGEINATENQAPKQPGAEVGLNEGLLVTRQTVEEEGKVIAREKPLIVTTAIDPIAAAIAFTKMHGGIGNIGIVNTPYVEILHPANIEVDEDGHNIPRANTLLNRGVRPENIELI